MSARNSEWLIAWNFRLHKHAPKHINLCEEIARATGEMGNNDPSDKAIALAESWEPRILADERPWEDKE